MKSIYSKLLLIALVTFMSLPMGASAQTTKPRMRRTPTARRVVPLVPVRTNLKVRLEDTLSSKDSRAGDKFTATVLDPVRFNEATVRGHIRSIVKSGKMLDGRTGTLHGYVTRVYDSNTRSDEEGGVQSEGRGRQAIKRGAIGGTAGAIIGAIAGGGKGAAIGLILGGAGGAGSLAIGGSKELKLEAGTEMLIHVTP